MFDAVPLAESSIQATIEPFSIPVDCTGASVGDPPSGTVFTRQSDVDDMLTEQGWTAFQHIYSVLRALPPFIKHQVDIDLAAGIHYADPVVSDYYAFPIEAFTVDSGGTVQINGRPLSEWTQLVIPQTITAFQQASNDPWVQVSGTPFAGLDLRGRMAILSNGAYGIINDHDDNTLHLMKAVLPNPTVSVDTVFVGRPNTSIRNALAATPTTRFKYYLMGLKFSSSVWGADLEFADVQLEGVGGFVYVTGAVEGSRAAFRRVIIDHEYERLQIGSYGGDGFQTGPQCTYDLQDVGIYADPAHRPADYPLWATPNSYLYAYSTYACNHSKPVIASGDLAGLLFRNLIVDNLGSASAASVQIEEGAFFQNWASMGGAIDRIRNAPNVGLELHDRGYLGRNDAQLFYFENCAGPCVRVRTLGRLVYISNGLKDGGGNLDVGIEVVGPSALLQLPAGNDVTGALGDVRMSDGDILSYSDIQTYGPYSDSAFNRVEKS